MTKLPPLRLIAILVLGLSLSSITGCQQLDLIHRDPLARLPKSSPRNPVKEVICLWEPAEGTGLDGKPCRGFAGQILFFATASEAPVLVKGTVDIYVFDDQGTVDEQAEPIETFTFAADQWDLFSRPNKSLGATYQIFIPYTRKGSHEANCTVRVRYTPTNEAGIPIYSKMASILLAGPKSVPVKPAPSEVSAIPEKSRGITPDHTPLPLSEIAELRKIAHSVTQPEATDNKVTPAVGYRPSENLADDRERLKQKMAEVLGDSQPDTVPWKPETRTIRPHPVPEAAQHSEHHPLEGF